MLKTNLNTKIKLSNKFTISNSSKCFIVAEISANHSGNLNILKRTMLAAKKAGANAVKIQTYEAETMTLNAREKAISFYLSLGYSEVCPYQSDTGIPHKTMKKSLTG